MKTLRLLVRILTLSSALLGCSTKTKSPDVSDSVRRSLDKAGLKDVSVNQDRDKGVVTLGGQVASDNEKSRAESVAKSLAGEQVIANQIGVIPPATQSDAKTILSDLDGGIDKNLAAALLQNNISKGLKYDVKNGVVRLTGQVNSQAQRSHVANIAAAIPNVQQVVNELQVTGQKATSSR